MKKKFNDYCRDYILDHIHDYVGHSEYGSELGYTLTQGPNADGTLTYSTHEAMEYLRDWWWECSYFWDYEKSEFGSVMYNPFENPEAYMVCMVIEGVNDLLAQCESIDQNWYESVEITQEMADQICEEIMNYNVRWAQ